MSVQSSILSNLFMPHSVEKLLIDIRIACQELSGFVDGKTFESFLCDRLLQLALEREFEIIGEALVRLERLDPKQRKPDITLARDVLGWEPKVQLEAGLKKTIEYFAQSLQYVS